MISLVPCSGTEIIHEANSENLNLFADSQHQPARANAFRCERFLIARAEQLLSNGLPE
jgi:hypothetical protein